MNSQALICEFTGCKLILDNPVTMPCGNSICKHHLEQIEQSDDTKYNCFFCLEQHEIPKNGFGVNIALMKMIQNFYELDPIRKIIIKSFNELNDSVNEYNSLDSDVYIYDYFAEIRNKVDLHREELIEEITERSEKIILQLNMKEQKCKSNAAKIAKIDKNYDKLASWKREIRKADKNKYELNQLLGNININKEEAKQKIKHIKNNLLLGETIEFKKIENSSLFGGLIIKKNKISLSKECGKLLRIFNQHTNLVGAQEVDEYSNRLITASNDHTIKIWDLESGDCLKTLTDHKNSVTSILTIPNNKFVSGSTDETIIIWDLNSYKCLNKLQNKSAVLCLCLLSQNQIACGCFDGSISIWNLNNSNKVKTFKAHDAWITHLLLADKLLADKTKLISCSRDENIKIWSLVTCECIQVIKGHLEMVNNLELTKDLKLLSSSIDKTVKLWQIETGKVIKSIRFDHPVYWVKTLNKDTIAVALHNGEIQIYSLNNNMQKIKTINAHSSSVFRLNFVASNGCLLSASTRGDIKLWKIFD